MNLHITTGQRVGKPYILTIEDKSVLQEGQTEFQTTQTSPFVNHHDCVSTQAVYDAIKDKAGTLEAPALIASVNAPTHQGRQNVYIENGSLKLITA